MTCHLPINRNLRFATKSPVTNLSFHQWKRKSYSLFAVVGKAIRIGVLAVIYVLNLAPLSAQTDTVEIHRQQNYLLEEVEVTAERTPMAVSEAARLVNIISRKEIEAAGAGSIDELLDHISGVDQRQRGPGGIQSDISINGGTYEQVMVLLNGINITDPQTGHFHMDIPVPVSAIERIEIVKGSAARVMGPNAYSGAVNIVTRTADSASLTVNSHLGQYQYRNADVFAGSPIGTFRIGASSSFASTGGYRENTDSRNGSVYLSGSYHKTRHTLSWQAGANKKAFGANDFYSPSFPDQYEETASLLSSLSWKFSGKIKWKQDIYFRYHQDEFHLFRYDAPSWYSGPNNHLSRIIGSQHNFWFDSGLGRTSFGVDLRSEMLWSNVLGDSLSVSDHRTADKEEILDFGGYRNHASLFAEHRWGGRRIYISGGLLAHVLGGNSAGMYYYPGIDLSYRLLPDLKLYTSAGKSIRLPSFTEMYFTSPTHRGNRDLLPESAWDYTLGSKLARNSMILRTSVNARWSENSIDWVREKPDDPWESRNSSDFFTLNLDAGLRISNISLGNRVRGLRTEISYHYSFQQQFDEELDSKYVMDYLKHKVSWQSSISFLRNGRLFLGLHWSDRAGEYTDWDQDGKPLQQSYDPFLLADLRMSWRLKRTSFTISINNLFNTEYADFGHIWQPGRWMKVGVNYQL